MSQRYLCISFFFALSLHLVLLVALLYTGNLGKRRIFYSPAFSVSLYESLPGRGISPAMEKPKAVSLKPKAKPNIPPKQKVVKKVVKEAWKVKGKRKRKSVGRAKVSTMAKRRAALAEKEREKRLLERALARVSKEVAGGVIGGAGFGRESLELKYKGYYDEIWRRVKASWILPEEVVAQSGELETSVVVKIDKKGGLLEMELEKASGNKLYDESCIRAVKKAAPFPPLPEDYPRPIMELGIRFRPGE